MERKIFALVVAASFFYIASPLALPIAMGIVFGVLFNPWLDYLEKKGLSRLLGSSLVTSSATILVILPTSVLIFLTAKTGFLQLQTWRAGIASSRGVLNTIIDHPKIQHMVTWMSGYAPVDVSDFARVLHELAASVGSKLGDLFGSILSQLPGMILSVVIVVLSMYFVLIDGKRLTNFVRKNSFFTPSQTDQLLHTMKEICRSVILAALISGVLQAFIEVISCIFAGISSVALIGLCVFIASFIPIVGSLPVTLFVAAQQLAEGNRAAGIFLLVVGIIIFAMDNAVRSLFLRGSANLHPFLAFIAALGGLQTLGFVGVFMGPICAALFIVTLKVLTHHGESR